MISRTGVHAVRALVALAGQPKGQFAGAAEIAHSIDAPPNYLGKLLQSLARQGLVISQKGSGGGFRLAKSARQITLWDIVNPIEQLDRWQGCVLGRKSCSDANPCAVHDRWKQIRERYLHLLRATTLADVSASESTLHLLQDQSG